MTWIRVAHVNAWQRFWEAGGPHAGLRLKTETAERTQCVDSSGSFSVVQNGASAQNGSCRNPQGEPPAIEV